MRSIGRIPGPARLAVAAFALFAVSCSPDGPSGPRAPARSYLGLAPNLAPGEDLGSVVFTLKATGVDLLVATIPWDRFETSPGVHETAGLANLIAGARSFGAAVYVNLQTVDTNQRRLPADLSSLAFDDTAVVARLDRAIDALVSVLRDHPIVALSLGNEVDAWFGGHPSEFAAFRALFAREVTRLHAALPGLPIGVSTISPIGNPNAAFGDSLNAIADLAVYTDYPFEPGTDFVHRPPASFESDLAAMRDRNPGKPIALQEVGYSSSPTNGSSDSLQADMVRRFRSAMAGATRDRLLFGSWFLYTDLSAAQVDTLIAYYGFETPGFRAYLGNLGLRHSDGTPKPGWAAWAGLP